MKFFLSSWVFRIFLFSALSLFFPISCSSSSSFLSPSTGSTSIDEFRNDTAVDRRVLKECQDRNLKYIQVNVSRDISGIDDSFLVVLFITGVIAPAKTDWIAMISPSESNISYCPSSKKYYEQTGDFSDPPLLCHYPVKVRYVSDNPFYVNCTFKECQKYDKNGACVLHSCHAWIPFIVVNIRTDVEFVLFGGGFDNPCILGRTGPSKFDYPQTPLFGRLSSFDSTGTSIRLTWTSGDKKPQKVLYGENSLAESVVRYGENSLAESVVTTFTKNDMCGTEKTSPAKDFGWHDPGYIHSAVMKGLQPSRNYFYKYGSNSVGWSKGQELWTPPAGGSDELKFIAFGDMGKSPPDNTTEHYMQPGSISVIKAIAKEVSAKNVDSIFHIGGISFATGFLVQWDYFFHLIDRVASRVPYMTAIGSPEMDYPGSASIHPTTDSGGECGVPYWTYFQMPTVEKHKPWYSIKQGPIHFIIVSTEHNSSKGSDQYKWLIKDLASVNRSRTPWLIFMGHRHIYSSLNSKLSKPDPNFVSVVEPLLLANKVDLVLVGHIHNYERTCAIYNHTCKAIPQKDRNGTAVYVSKKYTAPVHAVVGTGGFTLDKFPKNVGNNWSLSRISEYGYLRGHATREELKLEFVESKTAKVADSFRIIKSSAN